MKILKIFGLLVIILAMAMIGGHQYFKSRLPAINGQLEIPNLSKQVKVYRDEHSIPHIVAQNKRDAFRALGFVIAGDRLFHMDFLRRIANGQLSEVLGPVAIKWDILLRTLKLRETANQFLRKKRAQLDPEMLALMEAFYQGVQHFVDTQPLPIEFMLLGYKPKPFTIEEGMAISGYMALSFAEGIIADTLFSELYGSFPREMVEELDIKLKNDHNVATKNYSYKPPELDQKVTSAPWFQDLRMTLRSMEEEIGLFHGSNSWIISGKRSKSGFPLLANDPHIAFSNPSVWYEAHLKTPDFEIYGHFLPLVPFPAIGHNRHRGWTVTMAEVDDLDVYQEKIDWEKKQVLFKNEWVPLKIEKEIIKVKGRMDHELEVVSTPHGPLIDQTKYGKKDKHLSVKWSYHHPDNNVAATFYKMMLSKNMEDIKEALSHGAAPGLNITWADKEGNIGYHVLSKIPLRPEGVPGHMILVGWTGEHEYVRYLDISENPQMYNPEDGVIITANYKPEFKSELPLPGYYQPGERFERIYDEIQKRDKWSLEGLKRIQNDSVAPLALAHKKILLPILKKASKNPQFSKAIKVLEEWDGSSHPEDVGPTLYYEWTKEILKVALGDQLTPEQFEAFLSIADAQHFFKTLIKNESSLWWDIKGNRKIETRDECILLAFEQMLSRVEKKLGSNISKWNWGRVHTLEFIHPFGRKKPLNLLFNIGPFPVNGSYFQINNMSSKRYKDDFKVTLGPSTRRLIDFKDASTSLGILPTGNSGRVFSKYYKDQAEMFINGKYRKQYLNISDVKANGIGELTLLPK